MQEEKGWKGIRGEGEGVGKVGGGELCTKDSVDFKDKHERGNLYIYEEFCVEDGKG